MAYAKIVRAEIGGAERVLCYSLRVARDVARRAEEREASGDDSASAAIEDAVYTLCRMMDAGAKWAKANGVTNPEPVGEEYLLDVSGTEELKKFIEIIKKATEAGSETGVETAEETGKNI